MSCSAAAPPSSPSWQEIVFHELLRAHSAYLVTDPETADYFYLPVYTYWYEAYFLHVLVWMPAIWKPRTLWCLGRVCADADEGTSSFGADEGHSSQS